MHLEVRSLPWSVSCHTIPSRLTEVPGSQGPRQSGSVSVDMSQVSTATEWVVTCQEEAEDKRIERVKRKGQMHHVLLPSTKTTRKVIRSFEIKRKDSKLTEKDFSAPHACCPLVAVYSQFTTWLDAVCWCSVQQMYMCTWKLPALSHNEQSHKRFNLFLYGSTNVFTSPLNVSGDVSINLKINQLASLC